MTRNEEIRISFSLGWGEKRVERVNTSPIREEMTLIVVGPRVIAEIVCIVNSLCEGEIF